MGCVSSKHFKKQFHGEKQLILNHVVSLTSSTYGALNLEDSGFQRRNPQEHQEIKEIVAEITAKGMRKQVSDSPSPSKEQAPEEIDARELMEGLEEGAPVGVVDVSSNQPKKSPKSRVLLKGFGDLDVRSPLKFMNQIGSPRKAKTFGGKENKVRKSSDFSTPKQVLRANNNISCKAALRLSYPMVKDSPNGGKMEGFSANTPMSRRRSFSPLFDPELVALYEKELCDENEQIKRVILPTPRSRKLKNLQELESMLQSYEQKCPPGGENGVVIYTTTLRGIRKTFEDCNALRSIVESYHIHLMERDVSMDSGFKEELRGLMGTKEVKVPLLFVKGRMIGGADQVLKLEEEGKLGILFDGLPKAVPGGCEGCAGVRFVMCVECNGSCKVLDEQQKKMVKCGDCNENGLIHCPICC